MGPTGERRRGNCRTQVQITLLLGSVLYVCTVSRTCRLNGHKLHAVCVVSRTEKTQLSLQSQSQHFLRPPTSRLPDSGLHPVRERPGACRRPRRAVAAAPLPPSARGGCAVCRLVGQGSAREKGDRSAAPSASLERAFADRQERPRSSALGKRQGAADGRRGILSPSDVLVANGGEVSILTWLLPLRHRLFGRGGVGRGSSAAGEG